jgi:hypothetical protein
VAEYGQESLWRDTATVDAERARDLAARLERRARSADEVPGGEAAIPEFVRVLRRGGRLGVFDFDADMTVFTHPDRALTRRIVAAASDATAVNGWLVRQLPSLFQHAGLVDVRARGFFPLETERQSFYANMAERSAEVAVKAGAITENEGRLWLDAFHEQGARGPIVAGRLHIFVWGRKPV